MAEILQLLQGVPLEIILTMFVVIGVFGIWMYERKLNVDTITVIMEAQSQQIKDLQDLVHTLTDELAEARKEITEISNQNKELRIHIVKLERILLENNMVPPTVIT